MRAPKNLTNKFLNLLKKCHPLKKLSKTPKSHLALAQTHLSNSDFKNALIHYEKAHLDDATNLEPYIGIGLSLIGLRNFEAALRTGTQAQEKFGGHDAVWSLIVRSQCNLDQKEDAKQSIIEWNLSRRFTNSDSQIYNSSAQLTNLILATDSQPKIDELLEILLYQKISRREIPELFALLFNHHEYNRPLYIKLWQLIHDYDKHTTIDWKRTATSAAIALSFGFIPDKERKKLIDLYFFEFDLFSHWSFILLNLCWNPIWDKTITAGKKNIDITIEKINALKAADIDNLPPAALLHHLILESICRNTPTNQYLNNTRNFLTKSDATSKSNDFSFISKNVAKRSTRTIDRNHPLKIAICVSGQLRGFKEALSTWKNLGLEEHDVTYIIHTWENTGCSVPVPPKDERALPKKLQAAYREAWNKIGQEKMFERYPNLFFLWQKQSTITRDELSRAYGTSFVFLENDSTSPFLEFSSAQKMYYKIWRCHEEMKKTGTQFDLTIRMRPDFSVEKPLNADWYAITEECKKNHVLFCEHYSKYLFPGIGYAMPDQFAIATPETMEGYAAAYPMTMNFADDPKYKFELFPRDFTAHKNVAYATLYHAINVKAFPLPCSLTPTFRATENDLKNALLQDAKNRMDKIDKLLIDALGGQF